MLHTFQIVHGKKAVEQVVEAAPTSQTADKYGAAPAYGVIFLSGKENELDTVS